MSQQHKSVALVLSSRDYRDCDRWVTVLTPDRGKISLLAKSVRTLNSKRRAILQPGFLVRIAWVEKGETLILTEAGFQKTLNMADQTLERFRDLQSALEIVFHIALENVEQEELFHQANDLIQYIAETPGYHRGAIRQRLLEITEAQGLEVEVDENTSVSARVEEAVGRKLRSFAFLSV